MPDHIDIMGVQEKAGGVGIDLTRARYAVDFSRGYSLGDYEQKLAPAGIDQGRSDTRSFTSSQRTYG